jgi:hypothetical protein
MKQKNGKRTKAKVNIHSLLNILKAYYANTHQVKAKPSLCSFLREKEQSDKN